MSHGIPSLMASETYDPGLSRLFSQADFCGSFVARVDPETLNAVWSNQLVNTVEANEWDYPGVVSILRDGYLYVIYGYRIAKLDPRDG